MVDNGSVSVCWADHHVHPTDMLETAKQVRKCVPHVGPADCLIVAVALSCRSCHTFYTTDRELLTNPALRRFCSTGGRNLILSEAPPA